MSEIELYSYDACPYAQRTRMVLAEKGLDFELHEVDVYDKPADWATISPYGKVPVLRHDGASVYESTIVNQYIDEAFPEPPLMPASPLGRAQARIWMDYCETRLLPASHNMLWQRDDTQRHAQNLARLYETLRFIETEALGRLGGNPYWFGAAPGLVDFQYLPFVERFVVSEALAGFEWPADCPRLRQWFDAMCERPSVRPTLRPLAFHLEQHHRLAARIKASRAAAG